MTDFTSFAAIPAIAATVYTVIDIIKTATGGSEKFKRFIPLLSCAFGAVIGIICFYCVPGVMEASNVFIAIVLGAASGLSATGTNQVVKQLTKGRGEKESE